MYALKPMGIPGKAPAHVKAWTQQEDDLLITLYPQHTARDIAGRLGAATKEFAAAFLVCVNRAGLASSSKD
ncbi:TPA: hypothetical protein JTP04_001360 [Escherichia coli]|nr:hypothetical protein [Escherichia coli]